ncbi:hypothetical protein JRG19_07285 [Pseudoclavibacter alba]|uniref:hypothetical protein n=1 Tax=Pseudoclavibacter albus TaxID=272241 RepID=UPI0019D16D4C|nr:hypothetical protein [Pseudoclavibacter alba]MBN6778347.1 hypothetical protein [Pseudoclavibacter alba]
MDVNEDPRANDAVFAELWREALPAEASSARCVLSLCNSVVWSRQWWTDTDGTEHQERVKPALRSAASKARWRESGPGKGAWILLQGEFDGHSMTFTREHSTRAYWGDHPGAPLEPPASAADIRPSDDTWRDEMKGGWYPRDEQHWPDWLPRESSTVHPKLNTEAPLTGRLAELAKSEPWSAWIPELDRRLAEWVERRPEVVKELVEDGPDGHARQAILENIPIEFAEWAQPDGNDALAQEADGVLNELIDVRLSGVTL